MARGAFTSTFYVPEGATVSQAPLNLHLTDDEQEIFDDLMETETLQRLKLELQATGHGLVWNKDHFEMITNRGAQQCTSLMAHHTYLSLCCVLVVMSIPCTL